MKNDKKYKQKEIYKIKKIIDTILDLIEISIKKDSITENQELLDFIIGKKDSITSTICKLGNLLLKINSDELKNSNYIDNTNNIEEIDIELLREYLKKTEK